MHPPTLEKAGHEVACMRNEPATLPDLIMTIIRKSRKSLK